MTLPSIAQSSGGGAPLVQRRRIRDYGERKLDQMFPDSDGSWRVPQSYLVRRSAFTAECVRRNCVSAKFHRLNKARRLRGHPNLSDRKTSRLRERLGDCILVSDDIWPIQAKGPRVHGVRVPIWLNRQMRVTFQNPTKDAADVP